MEANEILDLINKLQLAVLELSKKVYKIEEKLNESRKNQETK